jgi:hypothetical protein
VVTGRDPGADECSRENDRKQPADARGQPADEQRELKRRDQPGPRGHGHETIPMRRPGKLRVILS